MKILLVDDSKSAPYALRLQILSKSTASEKLASLLERLPHNIEEPSPGKPPPAEPQLAAGSTMTEQRLHERIRTAELGCQ